MGGSSSLPEFDYEQELFKDKTLQAKEVDEKNESKDCSKPIRNVVALNKVLDDPFDDGKPCRTIWAGFQRGVEKFPNANCLGTRKVTGYENGKPKFGEYLWLTYTDVDTVAKEVAKGLLSLGIKAGSTCGICSGNRVEWTATSLGFYATGLRTVALYDTLGKDAVEYIINHSEAPAVFVSKAKLPIVLDALPKCGQLKYIIQFDVNPKFGNEQETLDEKHVEAASKCNVKLIGFSELRKLGREANAELTPPKPEDLAFIMYTSGTTGNPKGVMLLHSNVMAALAGGVKQVLSITEKDVHISYLPLAHIFETLVQVAIVTFGGAIGFFNGDIKGISEDLKLLRPTVFCGVPRVYSRFYDRIMSVVNSNNCLKRGVFNKALSTQVQLKRVGQPVDAGWDKKVFSNIRNNLGFDRCRLMVTGAAPIPPYLLEFFQVAINPANGFVQGYGLTETAAAMTICLPGDHRIGHVGPPTASTEIKLRDVPEMNYLHSDAMPRGEILVRGPTVFVGYYKNEEATKECLDAEGWFATGDVGRINPNGTLSIIDRKKNIFKLSQGEYIAAEAIEGVYGQSPLIGQIFIYGNSYKSFIVAVVVPNAANTINWATEKGWWQGADLKVASVEYREAFKKLVAAHGQELKAAITESMQQFAKAKGLKPFELAKDIIIESTIDEMLQGFTVENDCMTPSFKLRRPFLVKRYKEQLMELYKANGEPPKADEKW